MYQDYAPSSTMPVWTPPPSMSFPQHRSAPHAHGDNDTNFSASDTTENQVDHSLTMAPSRRHTFSKISGLSPIPLRFSEGKRLPVPERLLDPPGYNSATRFAKEISDEEYQKLMDELRDTAEKVLEEDEWMYPSSDDILGFSDNFQNIDYKSVKNSRADNPMTTL